MPSAPNQPYFMKLHASDPNGNALYLTLGADLISVTVERISTVAGRPGQAWSPVFVVGNTVAGAALVTTRDDGQTYYAITGNKSTGIGVAKFPADFAIVDSLVWLVDGIGTTPATSKWVNFDLDRSYGLVVETGNNKTLPTAGSAIILSNSGGANAQWYVLSIP